VFQNFLKKKKMWLWVSAHDLKLPFLTVYQTRTRVKARVSVIKKGRSSLASLTFERTEKTVLGETRKADKVKLIPKGITLISLKSTKEVRFK